MPRDKVIFVDKTGKPIHVWRPSKTRMVSLFLMDGEIYGELSEVCRIFFHIPEILCGKLTL